MPGDWWNQGSITQTLASSIERWMSLTHSSRFVFNTTELTDEFPTADALTLEYLMLKQVGGNRTGMVCALRKNGADTSLIITMNGTSGFFVTAGGTTAASISTDQWGIRLNGGTGGSVSFGLAQLGLVVTHASKFYKYFAVRGPVAFSVLGYLPVAGQMTSAVTTVETTAQAKQLVASTVELLLAGVSVNTRTVNTFVYFRDDGVDSSSGVTIPASTTGSFTVSLSDSVAAGSQVNFRFEPGAGTGSLTLTSTRAMLAMADRGSRAMATATSTSGTQINGTPRYWQIVGDNAFATSLDSPRILRLRRGGRLTGIGIRLVSVTGSGTTWVVEVYRAGGTVATGISVTLSANTSGWFDATPTPVDVDPAEDYSIVATRTAGSGTFFFAHTSVYTDEPAGGTTFPKTLTANLSFTGALARVKTFKRTHAASLSVTRPPEWILTGTPALTAVGNYKTGNTYNVLVPGWIVGARFWRDDAVLPVNERSHVVQLWNAAQALVSTSEASAEAAGYTGWVYVKFPTPVWATAGEWTASVDASGHAYSVTPPPPAVVNAAFVAFVTGRYKFSGAGFPDTTIAANYFVDLHFPGLTTKVVRARSVTGQLRLQGVLTRRLAFARSLAGQLRLQGALKRLTARRLTGVLSMAGALRKRTTKGLAGTLRFTSTVARLKAASKAVAGTLSFASTLTRLFTPGGPVGKQLTAVLSFQGAVRGKVSKRLTAALSFTGALRKRTSRTLTGTLGFTSTLGRLKAFSKGLAGVLSFSGALTRRLNASRSVAGVLRLQGVVKKGIAVRRTATLALQSTLARRSAFKRTLTGVLRFTGVAAGVKLGATFFKTLTGILSFGPSTLGRDYTDNPEPPAGGPDPWIVRMRRRWGGK